nr:endo-1,4-beta-xylanase [Prolixibacteraceae bacterium]
INNIHSDGFELSSDEIDGVGGAGTELWKWINLSESDKQETPVTFTVPEGELTQIIQIGARENGLDFDLFAFGKSDVTYKVSDLGGETEPIEEEVLPIADGQKKFLGNIYSSAQRTNFTEYWNQVAPENAGKWGSVERTRDNMNWYELDAAYKLAKDNGFPFRFHVLLWGNQQPSWIENLPASEQLEEIEEWFAAVAARYSDIDFIEVVNEPLHDPPTGSGNGNYMEALGGSGASGWDWIVTAFELARKYFPDTKLMINEYSVVNEYSNMTKYINIVNILKNEDLIDCVGFQAHAFSTRGSTSTMVSNLDRLAELGLPIYATELDIDGATDQIQLDDYKRIFKAFWEHDGVHGITLWGWRPGLWRNAEKAYLVNSDGSERPALVWLREYVASAFVSVDDIKNAPSIVVYPNPVTNKMVTFTGVESIISIKLFDLNGRQIKQQQAFKQNRIEFDMNVNPGIYLVQLEDGANSFYKKLIVQ